MRETLWLKCSDCTEAVRGLLVSAFVTVGLSDRFVSDYLIQLAVDIEPVDRPGGPVQNFTDLHI